jgi:DnaK suppressor protein
LPPPHLFFAEGFGVPAENTGSAMATLTQATDQQFVQRMKKSLEGRAEELRRAISRTQKDGRTLESGLQGDALDRAITDSTKEFLFNKSTQERRLLNLTEVALRRISDGTFGECANCGNPINHKRLEAVPWAQYCIACQEKHERGELQPEE